MKLTAEELLFSASFLFLVLFGHYQVLASQWGYGPENGPSQWCRIVPNSKCCERKQSPVDIITHAARSDHQQLQLINYRQIPPSFTLTNNGHTIAYKLNHVKYTPRLNLALLHGTYLLDSFHFHWGSLNHVGSEHYMNGVSYPLEMHLVHVNWKYHSFQEAKNYHDGLAVIAVLFELHPRHHSEEFGKLFKAISMVAHQENVNHVLPNHHRIRLDELLPHDNHIAFHYKGSLTTPDCKQSVDWFVLGKKIPTTIKQLAHFRNVVAHHEPLVDNFRPIQPLYGRQVLKRQVKIFS